MDSGFVLLACAAHSFGFGLFHLGFWKLFDRPRTLRQTTLPNRAIIQIANIQLAWMFLAAGVICVLFRAELASTALGRTWLASMSAFWMLRLVGQFIWLRINHPLVHVLSLLFALGALLFALPLMP